MNPNHKHYKEMWNLRHYRRLSLQEIGNLFNLSHQRVSNILGNGSLPTIPKLPKPTEEEKRQLKINKFWSKIDIKGNNDCWDFKYGKTQAGYGHINDRGKNIYAHRFAWELTNGVIPDGLLVCHHCDNPGCCNPSHLFLGTTADNMHDRDAKGRNNKGKKLKAKL
jgi:hypothetical protein